MIQQGEVVAATPVTAMKTEGQPVVGQNDRTSQGQGKDNVSEKEDSKQKALELAQDLYLKLVQLDSVHAAHADHADYEVQSGQLISAINEAKKSFNLKDEEIRVKGKEYKETNENKEIVKSLRRVLEINKLQHDLNAKWKGFPLKSLRKDKPEDVEELEAHKMRGDLNRERVKLVSYLGSRLFKNKDFHENMGFIADHGDRVIDELDLEDQV